MYTVYKTVCLVNKKFYIGVHKTDNPMDSYLGSGKLIRAAIAKHGIENFEKEILFEFQEASDAFAKEAELVTKELIESGVSYNLKLGGEGGFDWINANAMNNKGKDMKKMSLLGSRKGGLISGKKSRDHGLGFLNQQFTDSRKKVSDEELLRVWNRTKSVRATLREVGLSLGGGSRRLKRLTTGL